MNLLKFTPVLLSSALLIACGSAPKPAVLVDFEAKMSGENAEYAPYTPRIESDYAGLKSEYEGYHKQAVAAYEDDNNNMVEYYTDLASTTLDTAVSMLKTKDYEARQEAAAQKSSESAELLKSAATRKEIASLKGAAQEVKLKDAELEVLRAFSINAPEYAPEEYEKANATFERAKAAYAAGETAKAQKIADEAIAQAQAAQAKARPTYDKNAKIIKVDAQYKKIMAKIKSEVPSATTRIEDRGLFISLRELFQTNKTELKDDKKVALKVVARIINEYPDFKVLIEGHTDNRGKAQKNIEVSEGRALNVLAFLRDSEGVNAGRLNSLGKGGAEPIDDNSKPKGRAQNQRVEVIFLRPEN